MPLPKSVQEQLEKADATLAQLNGGNTPAEVPPSEPPVEAPVVVEPQALTPPVAPVEPPVVAPAPVQPEPWEQRYRSLQGVHNSQMREAQQRERELSSRLGALAEQVARLEQQAPSKPEANPAIAKHEENFGADMVAMVRDVVGNLFMPQVQGVLDRLTKLESQFLGTTQAVERTAQEVFVDRLYKLVPDWEAVNADQGFLDWLAQQDPFSGVVRQSVLTAAGNQMDPERVAAVFNAYKATVAPAQQPSAPAPKPPSLDSQVSPRASAPAPVTPNPAVTYVKQSDFQKFYDDVAKGKYRHNPEEAARIESVLNLALAEGRVR